MAGEVSAVMEELRTQTQHQLAIRQSGISRPSAPKIMNTLLEKPPENLPDVFFVFSSQEPAGLSGKAA